MVWHGLWLERNTFHLPIVFVIVNMLVFQLLNVVYFWTLLLSCYVRLKLHPILFNEMEVKQKQQVVEITERKLNVVFKSFNFERRKKNWSVKSFYTYAGQFSFTKNIYARTCHNKILSALIHMSNVTLFFTSDWFFCMYFLSLLFSW